MSKETVKKLFYEFWANNVKTNYRKISVALGTTVNTIVSALNTYFISQAVLCGDIQLAILIIGIIIPLQGLLNLLCFYVFGKAKNGNGYGVPETKIIVDLIKKDDDLKNLLKEKIVEYTNNKSKVLNGGNK